MKQNSLRNLLIMMLLFTSGSLIAQPSWTFVNTGTNHTILVQPGVVTVDGVSIVNGDYVGAFFNDNGTLVCGGFFEYTGTTNAMTAWGDDTQTPAKDGFSANESFNWKVWRAAYGLEIDMVASYVVGGPFPNQGSFVANGMSSVLAMTGTAPAVSLSASGVAVNVLCNGACDGSIDLTVNGGSAPFSYLWSNSATTEDISGLCPGTYTVTVSESGGSTIMPWTFVNTGANHTVLIQSGTVTINGSPIEIGDYIGVFFLDGTDYVCGGYTLWTGSASNAVTAWGDDSQSPAKDGFYSNESFTWKVWKATDGAIVDMTAVYIVGGPFPNTGNYTTNGMSAISSMSGTYSPSTPATTTASFTITEPADIFVIPTLSDYSGFNVSVYGASDGSINLFIAGGTSPYSFMWSNGATIEDLIGITAGTYSLTVTDANGCTKVESYTLTEPAGADPVAGTATTVNLDCNGVCNGAIDLSVTGGAPPYTYTWSNGSTTEDLSGLCAGTYDVTISDSNSGSLTMPWTFVNTGANHTVLIQSGTVTINGNPIEIGDYIGVFFMDAGNYVCGGYTLWTGSASNAVTAWGDDTQSPAKDGFASNETFTWKVWKAADGAIVDMSVSYIIGGPFPNSSSYTTNGMSAILSLSGSYVPSTGGTDIQSFTITEPDALEETMVVSYISCFGGLASIDMTVTGGTPPYTFLWPEGSITEDLTNVPAGVYDVTITDSNFCTLFGSTTINQPDQLVVTGVAYDATCFGGNDGEINVSVSGGTAPYTYSWSNGAATEDVSGLAAGSYTLDVTDSNGCTESASFTVNSPTELLATVASVNPLCFGGGGSADLTVTGGTMPYTYLWSSGDITEDIMNFPAGLYNVTVTDANGCQATANVDLMSPSTIELSTAITDVLCFGDMTGAIDLTVSGGTTPYTSIIWNNSFYGEDISSVEAGTYDVEVTDANGCVANSSYTVNTAPQIITSVVNVNPTCFGGLGSIYLTVSGGVSPYTFEWSNGATTQDLINVTENFYEVTITDANGCMVYEVGDIYSPNALTITEVITNPLCYGNTTGSIDVTVFGGLTPYIYSWSNGATTADIMNLAAGTYDLSVYDVNGCILNISYDIIQPDMIAVSSVISDVSCNGGSDGAIDVTVIGGVSPYSFYWTAGPMTEDYSGLMAGMYSVSVYDMNGCESVELFTVTEPSVLSASFVLSDYAGYNVSVYGASDGSINITANGGTPPYSYSWSDNSTMEDLFNLNAGSYSVTVIDNNGCEFMETLTITEPPAFPSLEASSVITAVTCPGGSDGAIDVTVAGGLPPYSYSWAGSETTEDLTGLMTGTYSVTITDSFSNMVTLNLFVNDGQPAFVDLGPDAAICDGDSYMLDAGSFSAYNWSTGDATQTISVMTGGIYSVTVTDGNGCFGSDSFDLMVNALPVVDLGADAAICDGDSYMLDAGTFTAYDWSTGDATQTISVMTGGIYSVTVTDANGCFGNDSFDLMVYALPVVDLGADAAVCDGDSYMLDAGTFNAYNWSTGDMTQTISVMTAGSYSVTVTDANGCFGNDSFDLMVYALPVVDLGADAAVCDGNSYMLDAGIFSAYDWSTGDATQTISVMTAATYSVTVTDANGCFGNDSFDLMVYTLPVVDLGVNGAICDGESYLLDAGTFSAYDWSTGDATQTIDVMTAGTYSVTVTDANGCFGNSSFDLMVYALPVVDLGADAAVCDGDSYLLDAGLFDVYSWSTGDATQTVSVMTAGTYTVTVTDANGCKGNDSFDLMIYALPSVSLGMDAAVCDGDSYMLDAGTFSAYDWSTGDATQTISVMTAGTYSVTVTDANGCFGNDSFDLMVYALPVVDLGADAAVCDGDSYMLDAGSFNAYNWSTGDATQTISVMTAGSYSVTVTDANGCFGNDSFDLMVYALPVVDLGPDAAVCDGDSYMLDAGTFSAYDWSTGDATQTISVMTAGMYSVTVTDANGCFGNDSFDLMVYALPVVDLGADAAVCDGDSYMLDAGTFNAYDWSTGDATQTISVMTGGIYSVTVTNANGCVNTDEFVLTVNPLPIVDLGFDYQFNQITGTTVDAGVFSSYLWSTGETTQTLFVSTEGFYSVTVTDANGCSGSDEILLTYIPVTYPPEITNMTPVANSVFDGMTTLTITVIDMDDLVTGLQVDVTKTGQTGLWTQFNLPVDPADILTFNTQYAGIAEVGFSSDVFTFTFNTLSSANPFLGFPGWGDGEYLFTYIAFDQTGNQSGYYNNIINPVDAITYFIQAQYDEQVLNIPQGYSLISTFIDPVNPNVYDVFAPILSDVVLMKDENGNPFWPAYGLNNIGNMDIGEGYQINLLAAHMLTVQGVQVVPENNPISLPFGWSMFGNLRTTPMSVETALVSVVTDILVVKDGNGSIYWPAYSYNGIGDLLVGKGYKIRMTSANSFTYPANTAAVAKSNAISSVNSHYTNIKTTSSNMTIGIPSSSWSNSPEYGDEIAVVSPSGKVVGAGVYSGGTTVITVWGNDPETKLFNSMDEGMNLSFKLWSNSLQTEETLVVSDWISGDGIYTIDGVYVVGKIKLADIVVSNELFQNSPNPARDITEITFNLELNNDVTLSVYNLLGEKIHSISLGNLSSGNHSYKLDISNYPSGAYLYRINAGEFSATKQMNVID